MRALSYLIAAVACLGGQPARAQDTDLLSYDRPAPVAIVPEPAATAKPVQLEHPPAPPPCPEPAAGVDTPRALPPVDVDAALRPEMARKPAVKTNRAVRPALKLLASGDRLALAIAGEPELSKDYTIGSDGMLDLDLAGKIPAAGKSLAALRQAVTAAYKSGYLVSPAVTLTLKAAT